LSSHPNPANRYEAINREAQHASRQQSDAEIRRSLSAFKAVCAPCRARRRWRKSRATVKAGNGQVGQNPTAGGRYSSRVQYPSNQMQVYTGGNWMQINVPSNWRAFETQESVQFAPEGAYGDNGITHGALVGVTQAKAII
jgi:hypothetical protein